MEAELKNYREPKREGDMEIICFPWVLGVLVWVHLVLGLYFLSLDFMRHPKIAPGFA